MDHRLHIKVLRLRHGTPRPLICPDFVGTENLPVIGCFGVGCESRLLGRLGAVGRP